MQNLNEADTRAKLTLPEQKRITAILNERMEAVERARKAAEEQLSTINALPGALLRQAFRGEL